MAAVVVKPLMKLRSVLTPRYPAATKGIVGAAVTKAVIVSAFAPSKLALMKCRPGIINGLEPILPASFKKATIDPVKVIPPMTTPRYAVTWCNIEI